MKLAADITVTTMAGTRSGDHDYHAFSGTLDGDYHTITANLSGDGYGTALFYVIDGATLTNMRVRGTVATTGRRPATFAAFVEGSSTINHCWSTVAVSSTQTGWVDGGAFVARVSGSATLNMSDCAFHGSVTYTPTAYSGGSMVGYTQENATVNLTNCLYSPTALELTAIDFNPHVFVSGEERGNLTNCYYNAVAAASILENEGIDASGMTDEALAAALGEGWHVSNDMVLPSGLEAYEVTLYDTTGEVTLHDGDILTGTGGWNTNVRIAHGATVTLSGVTITAYYNNGDHRRPGITCLGDAVIVLAEGTTNEVKGGWYNPSIYVPQGHTFTLQGGGTLNVTGGDDAAGIGSGDMVSCGDITISGGIVTANGGWNGAGIGSGYCSSCGNINISGGIVTASGGWNGAGIGSGRGFYSNFSSCGNITISGGTVTATGGYNAAGIGSGYIHSSCGNITITSGVTCLVATAGQGCDNTIGAGDGDSTCGTVTIGGVVTGFITQSPYTYPANVKLLTSETAGYMLLENGDILTGTGGTNTFVNIAHGATVTLCGVHITAFYNQNRWPGITCLGNAVIVLAEGTTNEVKGGKYYPGIRVTQGHTLTIQGGGTLHATGGDWGAGIGSGAVDSGGNIILSGGIVYANGGQYAAGIGSGFNGSSCESITITNGVTMVTATAGEDCDNAIGAGVDSSCQTVTIGGVETGFITQNPFTTYPYTLAFNANGGTGTMDDAGFMYNVAQNLPANNFTNWGKTFDGWATSANGPKVYNDGQSVSNLTETPGATVTLYAKWVTSISAVGNEYTIYTATGWNLFCDMLTESNDYLSGSTVKLGADLIVTRMAGTFKGNFNGQGHTLTVNYSSDAQVTAPFRYVNGATITNLVTAGTISTTRKFAGGMIGKIEGGAVSITNCVSDVTISSSVIGDGTHGGFVGLANGGTLNITGCTFSGQMLGASTTLCGGFVGYTANGATTTITDCLFAPSNLEIHSGCTFSRAANMNSVTITNSYYTEPLGTAQGIHGITFATAWPAGEAISTYNVSGLTTYANGIQYGDTFYTNPDLNFSVNGDEYTIHTPTGWEMFCDSLANNAYGFFTGKTVKLADNFDNSATPTTRMAVTSGHDFSGIFDGNGKTLHINITATGNYVGAFLYAIPQGNDTVVFKNLKVTGTISTAYKYAGGILGGQEGKVRIINCESNVTINSTRSGDGTHGGFVGVTSAGELIIEGCAFTGKILTTGTTATTHCAGFVGWCNNNCTATITNSIYAPATLEAGETEASTYSGTFIRNGSPGDNCYYTRTLGSAQGIQGINHPDVQPSGDPTATYNVSGISVYSNGMQHGTTFYYNPNINFVLDIEGYDYVSNPGGWYLIASPIGQAIAPSADNGFITLEYDLYYFNQSTVGEEWRNYKDDNFLLTNGTGYLYASEIATTLVFTGTPYTGSGEIELAYTSSVPDLGGWNLVGNPYATTADVDRDFYVMNGDRSEIIAAEGNTVEAMEGIFVVANGNGETVTFNPMTRETRHEERIVLNLSRNNDIVIDRAIVRFGEGRMLPKFQLDPSHTKVYIPQDGKDYAIAVIASDSEAIQPNEQPINFKAEHNGTYTLTFSTENVDFSYLHLIDNMTGNDIDLLSSLRAERSNPEPVSYTFTARTTDYESRFKLVFGCGDANDDNAPFAFINNGNIIITADAGTASLQVVDMMGRVLVCRDASNASPISTAGMPAGVYVLRLIEGDNIRTQKIIIQ